jgi:hypothetical protein
MGGAPNGRSNQLAISLSMIALVAIVAFVIVLLAFFFRADISPHVLMIGQPHDDQKAGIAFTQYGTPDRLNRPSRTEDNATPAVGENRLPKAGDPQ